MSLLIKVTYIYLRCFTASFPLFVTSNFTIDSVQDQLVDLQSPAWETTRVPSFNACPIHWDQIKESLCLSLGSRPTQARELFTIAPLLFFKQPPTVCPFSHFSCDLQETSYDTSLWLGLSPTETSTPNDPLMLQNCFITFAVQHWFGCRATELGFVGDIGTIEIWLMNWSCTQW